MRSGTLRVRAAASTTIATALFVGLARAEQPGLSMEESLALVRSDEAERIQMIARVAPAVVCVFDETRDGGGSGVLIDEEGYGLTNFHVVMNMIDTRRGFGGLPDGKLYELEVLGVDVTGDVAMFKLSGREEFPSAKIGDSVALRPAQPVIAMGNPFALADDYTPTVTLGIISGLHRYQYGQGDSLVYTDCIQTDAAINPGNSGGPLFDMAGRVIGINGRASFEARGRVNVGLAYAVSINQIKRFMPALRAGLLARHGTLGATVRNSMDAGVELDDVPGNSVAARGGLATGDRVIHFGGQDIVSSNQFTSILGTYPAGWPIRIDVRRGNEDMKVEVRLDASAVRMKNRFQVAAEVNARAVLRVVARSRRAVAGTAAHTPVATIAYQGKRTYAGRPDAQERLSVRSDRGRELTVAVLDRTGAPVRVDATDGTDAWRMVKDQIEDLTGSEAMMLRAHQALLWQFTFSDETQLDGTWRHAGGDELEGAILEVIEGRLGEEQMTVAFDADTFLPASISVVDPNGAIQGRIVLSDYRVVEGFNLPHRLVVKVQGRPQYEIVIERYEVPRP